MYDYLIVGCGLYGATIAKLARDRGKEVLIVEKRDHIGGNIYTEKVEGITVHKYGAHIFHTSDEEVYKFVKDNTKLKNYINSPIANYKGKYYNLPFNMNTFYQIFNTKTPKEAKEEIYRQVHKYKDVDPKNFKQQALKLVGDDIYNIFIHGYTKKQWGREPEELSSDIIKRLPLRFTYNNNYFNDNYQAIPINGYTDLIQNLIKDCDILLNTDFLTLEKDAYKYKKIIYTGKIDEYFDYCFGKLEYRSLDFREEIYDIDNYQGVAVINHTEEEIPYTRTIEHKHFLDENSSKTLVTYEYPAEYKDGKEAYYPVNNERNDEIYRQYKTLADSYKDIHFGGRLGTYSYLDMDKVIRNALDFAKKERLYE